MENDSLKIKKQTLWEYRRKVIELAHKRKLIDYPKSATANLNSYGSVIEGTGEVIWRKPEHKENWKKFNQSLRDYYGKMSPEEMLNDLFGEDK